MLSNGGDIPLGREHELISGKTIEHRPGMRIVKFGKKIIEKQDDSDIQTCSNMSHLKRLEGEYEVFHLAAGEVRGRIPCALSHRNLKRKIIRMRTRERMTRSDLAIADGGEHGMQILYRGVSFDL